MDSAACSSNYVDLTLLDSEGSEDENHNNAFINKLMKLEDYNFACPNLKPVHCGICFDLVQPFSGVVLRECLHEFCKNCLKLAIVTSVEVPVKCPYRGGKDQFQYDCTLFLQVSELNLINSINI